MSIDIKKTSEALSKIHKISGDTMLRRLDDNCISREETIKLAINFFGTNRLYLAVDDTKIGKEYSTKIDGTSYNYDSSQKRTYKALCSVTVMLTNGKIALPIDHLLWVQKEIDQSCGYKTKIELAQILIDSLSDSIDIKCAILDGLFASKKMIKSFNEREIDFEMRFHSNRIITEGKNGKKVKVRGHKNLQLKNKRKSKTIKTDWDGIPIYVTAVKRIRKNSTIIIYQVSNFKAPARKHIRIYDYRWKIEMFFRTAKQSLGLTHCQSIKRSRQENHIFNVFFAYIIIQFERKKYKLKSPEMALRKIKQKSKLVIKGSFAAYDQNFHTLKTVNA